MMKTIIVILRKNGQIRHSRFLHCQRETPQTVEAYDSDPHGTHEFCGKLFELENGDDNKGLMILPLDQYWSQ